MIGSLVKFSSDKRKRAWPHSASHYVEFDGHIGVVTSYTRTPTVDGGANEWVRVQWQQPVQILKSGGLAMVPHSSFNLLNFEIVGAVCVT